MWVYGESGCLRERAHVLGLAEPANPADIELDDIEGFGLNQLSESITSGLVFACSDRYR